MAEQFFVSKIEDGNLAWRYGSAPDVEANRSKWFAKIGIDPQKVVLASLVGGADVRIVTAKDAGQGILVPDPDIPDADILITNDPSLKLMTVLADCLGIAVFDPEHGAIGLAHAGYRGVNQYVPQKMIQAMTDAYGTDPKKLIVRLSPGLHADYALFDEEHIEERFTETFWAAYIEESGNNERPWKVDWIQAALDQLEELGVKVPPYPADTYTGPYFSHRRSTVNSEPEARYAVIAGFQ